MRLHEFYFENLGGRAPSNPPRSSGRAGRRRIRQRREVGSRLPGAARCADRLGRPSTGQGGGRLFNQWVNEHDVGNPAGAAPLLVMDVFEHAFHGRLWLKRATHRGVFPERELEGGRGPALLTNFAGAVRGELSAAFINTVAFECRCIRPGEVRAPSRTCPRTPRSRRLADAAHRPSRCDTVFMKRNA